MYKSSKFVRINKLFLAILFIMVALVSFWLGGKFTMMKNTELVVDHYVIYKVSAQDTLSEIASKYKMDGEKDYRRQLHAIREANDINADCDIHSGEVLQIPVFIRVVK